MHIKVCCLSSPEEVAIAVAAGADILGFVAPPLGGLGVVPEARIAAMVADVPPGFTCMLLTGHTDLDAIAAQVETIQPGAIQLVRPTRPELRARLRERFPALHIVQVVHVAGPDARSHARAAQEESDGILLDSSAPGKLGATGETHDWGVSARIVRGSDVPVTLAGGLNIQNIEAAINTVRPQGVDLCTGVRTDGALDPDKTAAFIAAVRAAT